MIATNTPSGEEAGKVGSVLVVGGGIAGMQAALDCADAGFKVYLLERQPSIGGNMARLDKTFPTNDCAMCMISPKLVETGRHLNIEIISLAELEGITGEPGNFRARVTKKARYVDEEKCNGCGDCEEVCPVALESEFDGALTTRTAIYRMYPQAIPNLYAVSKRDVSPCRLNCPGGVNAQGYVALISKGKHKEALELVREAMPFVGSCGMVCAHPCEDECHRGKVDAPIAICALKRFIFEYVEDEPELPAEPASPDRVAVIGSGPTGLSCAYDLRRMGYATTVFEAFPHAGGMLRMAIPDFRLPPEVVERDVDWVRSAGVEIRLNTRIGHDLSFEDLRREYSAVFIASGAPRPRTLSVPGLPEGGADGVLHAIDMLKDIKLGKNVDVGSSVAVIGGGHTAWDVAVCARRLGAERVTVIELLTEAEMPPVSEEDDISGEAGIEMTYGTTVREAKLEGGGLCAIECVRMEPGEDDGTGCRPRIAVEGSEFTLPVDTLVFAIGQYSDLSYLPEEIERTEQGNVAIDEETGATNCLGVFAGGDVAHGPDIVIKGIAAGRRAAIAIDRHLRGETPGPIRLIPKGEAAEFEEKEREKQARVRLYRSEAPASREQLEATARQEAARCLSCGECSECFQCVKVCKAEALAHDMEDRTIDLDIGAVILTSGCDTFDASLKSEYAFGRAANVVTSIQFERILSASGPYQGHLQRPSDGKTPRKIGWIQCIGSRDVTVGRDYCSSVCCTYAIKEAIVAQEHEKSVEPTIFFTDLRAFGKGFEAFYNRARDMHGVQFVRAQVSSLKENPRNGNIIVRRVDPATASIVEEEFDIVVLSVGLTAHESTARLAPVMGVDADRYGFASGLPFEPVRSARDGIFLAGTSNGPKDIPDTVTQASAAASLCGEFLAAARGTQVRKKEFPPEKDVACVEPRIGVFICHCGTNIASVVDVEAVTEYAKTLGGVVHAQNTLYTCSQDTQEVIKGIIVEKDLNRVIVASCTPRTHEPLFKATLREAGLNEYMFEMVNIREQCSWVHRREPELATAKAKSLIRGGVGKAHLLEPLHLSKVPVTRAALVIGGGISGMTASLSLARQGFKVHLVEREAELGGNLRHIKRSLEGYDWQGYLGRVISEVDADPDIALHMSSEVDEVTGFIGNFGTTLKGHAEQIEHGVIIVATGADEWEPNVFLYGQHDAVITQRRLEAALDADAFVPETVVMIQCVGSRNEEREYCSRVCCGEAVKNALAIKEKNPETRVYILYRDIRTYEFKEQYYRAAREKGVMFIHFPDDDYPDVAPDGAGLVVRVRDDMIGEEIEIRPDLVVLAAANVPLKENNEHLATLLKVPLDKDGFFMEAHVKLQPVDFANAGVFLCGLAHSPKYTEENIAQALAAAGRAACILSKDSLEVGGAVAQVDPDKCASCLTCIRECAYSAPFINAEGKAEIEAAKCRGCGNCAAACPAKAIQLSTYTDRQEQALFESILADEPSFAHEHGVTREEPVEVGAG